MSSTAMPNVSPCRRPEQVSVQRLDLPRDFLGIESTHTVLSTMHMRHVAQARLNEPRYRADGTMQSLRRGTKKRYIVSGYGKGHELSEHAARDRRRRPVLEAWANVSSDLLRVEPQLHAPILREKGIISVSDVANADLQGLSEEFFLRTRWAEPYGGRATFSRSWRSSGRRSRPPTTATCAATSSAPARAWTYR
jgi:hypothetical protein